MTLKQTQNLHTRSQDNPLIVAGLAYKCRRRKGRRAQVFVDLGPQRGSEGGCDSGLGGGTVYPSRTLATVIQREMNAINRCWRLKDSLEGSRTLLFATQFALNPWCLSASWLIVDPSVIWLADRPIAITVHEFSSISCSVGAGCVCRCVAYLLEIVVVDSMVCSLSVGRNFTGGCSSQRG